MKLGIKVEELGRALDAEQIFQGESIPVTPLIGKLRVHIQEYVDQEDFLISLLRHYDAVLGTPWSHHKQVQIVYPDRLLKFIHKGRKKERKKERKFIKVFRRP